MSDGTEQKKRIPIKNLFYMLCYAWNVLAIKDTILVGEDEYDNATNLLARVFSFGVGKLIKSGFHHSYIENAEDLSTLRGKIQVKDSIILLSQNKKRLVCSFDDYSENDLFNQVVKYTMKSLTHNKAVDKRIKLEIKKQLPFFEGIDETAPTKSVRKRIQYNRNNVFYKLLIHISIMLYDNSSISENEDDFVFEDFFRQEQMQKVYELFILNFYAINLNSHTYHVYAPKFHWLSNSTEDAWDAEEQADELMPELRTDIVIENKVKNIQFIIDAKYYHDILVTSYQGDIAKFRRDHISQVYTYMDNSGFVGEKRGALLYPTVSYDVYQTQKLKPGRIFLKSLNLNRDWKDIEQDLMEFATRAD